MRKDIETAGDIRELVDNFYRMVVDDELLGPLFTEVVRLDFEQHLPIMYRFWESLLLGANTYSRQAFQPHLELHQKVPLREAHFDRWLHLFHGTVDALFAGEVAEEAKERASRIATMFSMKLRAHDQRAQVDSA